MHPTSHSIMENRQDWVTATCQNGALFNTHHAGLDVDSKRHMGRVGGGGHAGDRKMI